MFKTRLWIQIEFNDGYHWTSEIIVCSDASIYSKN